MSKLMRRGAIAGAVAGIAFAAWRFLASRTPDTAGVTYEAQPFPMPPRPVPRARTTTLPPVGTHGSTPNVVDDPTAAHDDDVAPDAAGNCPLTHPVKGKRASGIYHQPGGFAYDRTHADRCYRDANAAESDGLRAAKR